jgi:Tfp pilus assembly PilM family ATPase
MTPFNDKNAIQSRMQAGKIFSYIWIKLSQIRRIFNNTYSIIDIDDSEVRYLILRKRDTKAEIVKHGAIGYAQKEPESLGNALAEIKKEILKPNMELYVSLHSPDIYIRRIVLPKPKRYNDLKKMVSLYIQGNLPDLDSTLIWRYQVTDIFIENNAKKVSVLLAISTEAHINKYLQEFEKLNIRVTHLIPRISIIYSAYRQNVHKSYNDLLVDINPNFCHLIYFQNKQIAYLRNMRLGLNDLGSAEETDLNENRDLSFTNEESSGDKLQSIRGQLLSRINEIRKTKNKVLHRFFAEIVRLSTFIQSMNRGNKIDRILMTCGTQTDNTIISYIKERLSIPVYMYNFGPGTVEEEGQLPQGRSLYTQFSAHKSVLNLLPKTYSRKYLYMRYCKFACLLLLLSSLYWGNITIAQKEIYNTRIQYLGTIQEDYEKVKQYSDLYEQAQAQYQDMVNTRKMYDNETATTLPLLRILKYTSNKIAAFAVLDKISVTEIETNSEKSGYTYKVVFTGNLLENSPLSEILLQRYLAGLEQEGFFNELTLSDKFVNEKGILTKFVFEGYH